MLSPLRAASVPPHLALSSSRRLHAGTSRVSLYQDEVCSSASGSGVVASIHAPICEGRSVVQWNPSPRRLHVAPWAKHMKTNSFVAPTGSASSPAIMLEPSCFHQICEFLIMWEQSRRGGGVQLGWLADLRHLAAALSTLTHAGVDSVGNSELQRVHPTRQPLLQRQGQNE